MLNNFKFVESWHTILPILESLSNSIIVIKYGGSAMKEDKLTSFVVDDIVFLASMGIKIVLIHGGGPVINHWLNKVNIKPVFRNGMRMTNLETMEVVEMVLSGKVNKNLVSLINQRSIKAVGLSGKDSNLLIASKLNDIPDDYVGRVQYINIKLLQVLLNEGYIPVISSIACDSSGITYNINADIVAGLVASYLKASKLILLTDTPGIMFDVNDQATLIHSLNIQTINDLKNRNIISGGMIPKVDCCIQALKQDVESTHIIDGRVEHSLLISLLTNQTVGSIITS